MKMTINEALVRQRALRGRLADLQRVRSDVSRRETRILSGADRVIVDPQFDPKLVERKIVEIERFLLDVDAAIKKSNALTEIDIGFDVDKLLAPIE